MIGLCSRLIVTALNVSTFRTFCQPLHRNFQFRHPNATFPRTIVHYRTYLRGHREVNGGAPDGRGRADVYIRFGRSQICYELTLDNIAFPLTGAHIHAASAGANGPVIVGFPVNGGENLADCLDVPRETIQLIAANPAQFYVNVHNAGYPGGAIRGQLRKEEQ